MKAFILFLAVSAGSMLAYGSDIDFSNVPTASYYKASKISGIAWDSGKVLADCQKQISEQVKDFENKGMNVLKVVECKREINQFNQEEELVKAYIYFK